MATKKASNTATVNTAYDIDGNDISTDLAAIGAYFRALMDDIPDHVTDEQIGAVAMATKGDGHEADVETARIAALSSRHWPEASSKAGALKTVPPKTSIQGAKDDRTALVKDVSASSIQKRQGVEFGHLLGDDDKFIKHIEQAVEGKKLWDGAPLVVAPDILRILGKEKVMLIPEPGSGTKAYFDKHPDRKQSNRRFDKYETTDGESGYETADMWDSTPRGQFLRKMIEAGVEHAKTLTDTADTPKPYQGVNDIEHCRQIEKDFRAQRTNAINRLRRSIRFVQQVEALREFPMIGLRVNGKKYDSCTEADFVAAAKLTMPLTLYATSADPEDDGKKSGNISITAFNNLDLEEFGKMPVEDQRRKVLQRQLGRGRTTPGNTATDAKDGTGIQVSNWKQWQGALYGLSGYMDDRSNIASVHSIMNGNRAEKWEILEASMGAEACLKDFNNKYRKVWQAHLEDQAKADEAIAEAKLTGSKAA